MSQCAIAIEDGPEKQFMRCQLEAGHEGLHTWYDPVVSKGEFTTMRHQVNFWVEGEKGPDE